MSEPTATIESTEAERPRPPRSKRGTMLSRRPPDPVPFTLAGETVWVEPISIIDQFNLQAWVDEAAKSPYDVAKAEADRLEVPEAERDEWLREPRLQSRGWKSPRVGEGIGWADLMFRQPEGLVFFLGIVLATHHPDMPVTRIAEMAAELDPAALGELLRVALDYGPTTEEEPQC